MVLLDAIALHFCIVRASMLTRWPAAATSILKLLKSKHKLKYLKLSNRRRINVVVFGGLNSLRFLNNILIIDS